MLRVENLKVGLMPPLSFEVADGECLAVEAPSGTGKTRLLRAIADLDPAGGHIFLDGAERGEVAGHQWRRSVRYVAAEPAWWTDTPRPAFPSNPAASVRIDRLLRALGLDAALLDRPIAQLSTGERQRLALARSLSDEPRVLLLDEPCASLDPTSAAMVEELIKFQILSGRSVLLVSHDRGQVERLSHARLQLAKPAAATSDLSARGAPA